VKSQMTRRTGLLAHLMTSSAVALDRTRFLPQSRISSRRNPVMFAIEQRKLGRPAIVSRDVQPQISETLVDGRSDYSLLSLRRNLMALGCWR
jgi:hypothetical protein